MRNPHSRIASALQDLPEGSFKTHDHSSLSVPIESPQDFADAIGLPLERITKSIFMETRDGEGVMVVAPMTGRVNMRLLGERLGSRPQLADENKLILRTDYPRNAVSPLGLPADISVFIEFSLMRYETISIGGGVVGVEIEIAPVYVARLSGAEVLDLLQ